MLGGYTLWCCLCARGDVTVKTVREKASLLHTGLPSKGEVEHLSRRPGRDQPIADVDGEDLLCLSAGRRDQVRAVQRCRRYLQSRNLCSYSGSMLRLSPQKACRRGNDVRSLKKTGRTRIRRHADVLQDSCCPKEIVHVTEAESESAKVDVGHGTGSRTKCTTE